MEILELDARELSYPEPLERSVQILHRLDGFNCFHLTIHRYPRPLLMIAEKLGIDFEVCGSDEGGWHILFSKGGGEDLRELMKRYCSV
ncbi:MAG: DUF2249 domain-containing protein [Hydrogenimonas sp.]|nr:DUF2249 domain-containing protein [Hydrogenimonas sp.]